MMRMACDAKELIMFIKEGKNVYKTTLYVESVHLRTHCLVMQYKYKYK